MKTHMLSLFSIVSFFKHMFLLNLEMYLYLKFQQTLSEGLHPNLTSLAFVAEKSIADPSRLLQGILGRG